jgi:flagellin
MSNSVNTNYGALVALQSLNRTNQELEAVQKRVTTGYRVNDAVDDGAAFAVAQGIRSNIGSIGAVNQQLNIGKGLVGIAIEGATSVSNTLIKIREVTTKLADASLSAAQRSQYSADYGRLTGEVSNFINNATFNGKNLVNSVGNTNVIANVSGTQFGITGANLSASIFAAITVAAPTDAATAAALLAAGTGGMDVAEAAVTLQLNSLGGDSRRLNNQINFNSALQKASEEALGFIVDADLAKESSRLNALQVRQQLGTQTLGIANQGPQVLLGLFR